MPFRSQAQRRLFYAKARRGEISPAKVREWEEETPKKLPEKVAFDFTTHLMMEAAAHHPEQQGVGLLNRWQKKRAEMKKTADDDEKKGREPNAADKAKIRAFVRNRKGLSDKRFHEHSERLGVKNPKAEEVAYAEARALKGGKAEAKGAKKPDAKELAEGKKVEREHTRKPEVAREIAKDHLTEIPDYYTRLKKMEAEAKMKKSAAFVAGIKTALADEIYYGLRLSEDARAAEAAELARMEPGERERYLADMSARNARAGMTNPAIK